MYCFVRVTLILGLVPVLNEWLIGICIRQCINFSHRKLIQLLGVHKVYVQCFCHCGLCPSNLNTSHRGLLRQGLLKLNLWPVRNAEGTPDVSLTTPMGSTAVNPDDNHCVSLYIELDGYAHPVACPNELGGVDEEW